MPEDLATENRRLRGRVRRLEEDIAILQERLAYAHQQIAQLRSKLPEKPQMTAP
jgi:cell division septum initiation protein DivIVA